MAYLENKIGDFPFVSLAGEIIPPAEACVLSDRPGVDGTEKILVGNKGQPFQMVSQVDAESYAAGMIYVDSYKALIAGDAVTLVQGGVNCDGRGFKVHVCGVQASCRVITTPVGNKIHPPSLGWVTATWQLIAVPI